ncbi:MAG TPA: hypothetical protein VHJ34_06505 [Actinomycetota bacterium]|nr:hypothetical protein [Actinomycetota bacterium]
MADADSPVVVLRCRRCGDTFPAAAEDATRACPSCGAADVHVATEPLL